MNRSLRILLAAALLAVIVPAASQAQSPDAPYGFYKDTDHALCPPLEDYKWSPKDEGTWDNAENYDNHPYGSFGCRTRGAGDEPPPPPPPPEKYTGPFKPATNSVSAFEQGDVSNPQGSLIRRDPPDVVLETAWESNDETQDNEGNFRVSCQYSHFGRFDPILKPGGKSHLHMFFGNTAIANRDYDTDIAASGGGSCNGYGLNRSGYWVPALQDAEGNALVPWQIIVYYKTKMVDVAGGVQVLPQGLEMIAGNPHGNFIDLVNDPSGEEPVFWQCGSSGSDANYHASIPMDCPAGEDLNATVRFPQCVKKVNGAYVLESQSDFPQPALHPDHTQRLVDGREDHCGPGFVRVPEISVLLYWKVPENPAEMAYWRLSSDGEDALPGGSLHADWIGGWDIATMKQLVEGCLWPVANAPVSTGQNCDFGQLGDGTSLVGGNLRIEPQELHRVEAATLPK